MTATESEKKFKILKNERGNFQVFDCVKLDVIKDTFIWICVDHRFC